MRNNYRIVLSIIVTFVLTAYLQDRLPPLFAYMIKIPFVLAAFVYFMFRHNLLMGIIAGVFCSILGDGLSESSGIAYLVSCTCALFANQYLFKKQLPENSISCGLIALPISALVLIIQYASLAIFTDFIPSVGFALIKLLITALLTCIATIVLSEIFYRFELIVGNKEVVDEEFG